MTREESDVLTKVTEFFSELTGGTLESVSYDERTRKVTTKLKGGGVDVTKGEVRLCCPGHAIEDIVGPPPGGLEIFVINLSDLLGGSEPT